VQFDLNRTENGFTFFKSKTLKWDADEGKMRKMYEKGYATAIQSPWKGYSFEYEAVHKYEQRTGRLVEANAVFREQANENLIYENRIDIRIKTD
jgi:nucleoside 2-deoxyribosyltransferase